MNLKKQIMNLKKQMFLKLANDKNSSLYCQKAGMAMPC